MAPKAPYLASAAILYNSRGRSPQPACKAKPITGRTLGAQGQRPGGAINPRGEAASTFGNTGKHRAAPDPDRATGSVSNKKTRRGPGLSAILISYRREWQLL